MWGYEHGGVLMSIGMLLLWLLPVALLVWLFTKAVSSPAGNEAPRSPREILDTRYARGEIGREEYLARRSDLDGQGEV